MCVDAQPRKIKKDYSGKPKAACNNMNPPGIRSFFPTSTHFTLILAPRDSQFQKSNEFLHLHNTARFCLDISLEIG